MAGVDYHDTHSLALRLSSFRLIVDIAAKDGLPLHHIDIKTIFLHDHLHEDIYMHHPCLFEIPTHLSYVSKLNKQLCGLKQSPTNGIPTCMTI